MTRLSPTLAIKRQSNKATVSCAGCGYEFSAAGQPWKLHAALRERPIRELGSTYTCNADVVIREFVCPSCHALLDTETALKGDPFLDDYIRVEPAE